jgi:hypothetical protein
MCTKCQQGESCLATPAAGKGPLGSSGTSEPLLLQQKQRILCFGYSILKCGGAYTICFVSLQRTVKVAAANGQGPSWLLSALKKVLGSQDEGDALVSSSS